MCNKCWLDETGELLEGSTLCDRHEGQVFNMKAAGCPEPTLKQIFNITKMPKKEIGTTYKMRKKTNG